MNELLRRADEIPVTMVVAVAYLTLAFVTDPMQPATELLVRYGAARGIDIADGEAWRLLTHAFLHGGFLHLAFNLYALLAIGPTLERSIGSIRYAVVYLVGALGGGIGGCLWHGPAGTLVGGSGALFAMLGALVALMARGGREPTEFLQHQGGRQLLWMIAANLIIGFLIPVVSNAAHIGGLLTGFALTFFFLTAARAQGRVLAVRMAVGVAFAGALVAVSWPVGRWDRIVLEWERTPAGARRDELRSAFGLAAPGGPHAFVSDDEMELIAAELRKIRAIGH